MKQSRSFSIFLAFFTSAMMLLYWGLVTAGVTPLEELIPGYKAWALCYPLADGWIAICAFLTGFFLLKKSEKSILYGLLCGSSLIFLGITATTYLLYTGILSMFTAGEIIFKLGMRVFHFAAGTYFIIDSWKYRYLYFAEKK